MALHGSLSELDDAIIRQGHIRHLAAPLEQALFEFMLACLDERQVLLKLLLALLDSALPQFLSSSFLIPLAAPLRLHCFGFRLPLHSVNLRFERLKLMIQHVDFRTLLQSFAGTVFLLEMDGAHAGLGFIINE